MLSTDFKVMRAMLKYGNEWAGACSGWCVFGVSLTKQVLERFVNRHGWAEKFWKDGKQFYRLTDKGIAAYYKDPKQQTLGVKLDAKAKASRSYSA